MAEQGAKVLAPVKLVVSFSKPLLYPASKTFILIDKVCPYDTQIDGSEAMDKTVLKVSVASFALSLKLNLNMERSCEFLQFLLSETNLQYQEMKYILVSLYDIGLDCYRNKQLKEYIYNLCGHQISGLRTKWSAIVPCSLVFERSSAEKMKIDVYVQALHIFLKRCETKINGE